MTPEDKTTDTTSATRRPRRPAARRRTNTKPAADSTTTPVQVDVADIAVKSEKTAVATKRSRPSRAKPKTAPIVESAPQPAPAPIPTPTVVVSRETPRPPVAPPAPSAREHGRTETGAPDDGARRRRSRRGRRGRRGRKDGEQGVAPLSPAPSPRQAAPVRPAAPSRPTAPPRPPAPPRLAAPPRHAPPPRPVAPRDEVEDFDDDLPGPLFRDDDEDVIAEDDHRSEIIDVELDERPASTAPRSARPDDEEEEELDENFQPPGPQSDNFDSADFKRKVRREMVINVSAGHECRIAVMQDGRLEELFIEREATQSHVGNIYKGRVTNVEASIQAAFIDFGLPKHGFLHISDVQPQYFPNHAGAAEDVGRKIPRHHRPPIQKCFRRGQEVIVQITKEGVGTKGPTLSSYLSIPGRFLVMMPGMSRHGVSRKIEDEGARRQMRDILNELKLPSGMGFILRTAGMDRSKRELQRDLNYLLRLWKTVVERIRSMPSPAELYRESDLLTRTIRDYFTTDFDRAIVDDLPAARKIREFLQIVMPRTKTPIELYTDREPLFHRTGIEAEIERINMRHVPLASGGSLVIDSTEAMVAIDVNSGRFRSPENAEETALKINVEASEEIARQLRLRDLGGLIVCDFIDMRLDKNKRKVENALRDALKKHKERARISRISAFGLIEMTRQRQGPSIKRSLYADCPSCKGTGHVKMPESVMLDVMRTIHLAVGHQQVQKVVVTVSTETAFQLLNAKRSALGQIETETGKTVMIRGDSSFTIDQVDCLCEDGRGRQVPIGAGAVN